MDYFLYLGTLILIYGMLATAYSVLIGNTGMLSLSHVVYFGIGAYGFALSRTTLHLSAPLAFGVGISVSTAVAIVSSPLLLRLRGEYYTLATIAFNLIFFFIATNWAAVTNGVYGIQGIAPFSFGNFGIIISAFVLALCAWLVCIGLTKSVLQGRFGRVLALAREEEDVARMFGYRTTMYFFILTIVTALIAAIAGVVYAGVITYIDPNIFTLNESLLVLEAVIIGGVASTRGAFIGTALVFSIPEILQSFGFPQEIASIVRTLVFGVVLVMLIRFNPKGIVGTFQL